MGTTSLDRDLDWLSEIIEKRITHYLQPNGNAFDWNLYPIPELQDDGEYYSQFIRDYQLDLPSRLVFILALCPHFRPQTLDTFFLQNTVLNRGYSEFGGIQGKNHGGFLPTGETAAFLFSGNDLKLRSEILKVFKADHVFNRDKILSLEDRVDNEPLLSGQLIIQEEYLDLFLFGERKKPNFSSKFPATHLTTSLDWDDLIIDHTAQEEVNHIIAWMENEKQILQEWNLNGKIKPGYRALFYGPPGTGKTLTASLMGKQTGKDVYRVDLSMISSKWVGETEKNLARVFDQAESKDWILFFDEADTLFGKRSGGGSSQAKQSNQEVSYLLQRTEEYPGTVLLASNLKSNIDEAFLRRFQSMIYFGIPTPEERFKLWSKAFSSTVKLNEDIDLWQLSMDHQLTGGAIVNILKFCSIQMAHQKVESVSTSILMNAIQKELAKDGRMVKREY